MSDQPRPESDSAHGVHAAAREDGSPQEEPDRASGPGAGPATVDDETWAEATETGGDAT